MKKFIRSISYVLVALASCGMTVGVLALSGHLGVSKLDQLQAIIEERYIGEADTTAMEDAAAAAMVAATGDRWSGYISAARSEEHHV